MGLAGVLEDAAGGKLWQCAASTAPDATHSITDVVQPHPGSIRGLGALTLGLEQLDVLWRDSGVHAAVGGSNVHRGAASLT